jgi:hypothetical protein
MLCTSHKLSPWGSFSWKWTRLPNVQEPEASRQTGRAKTNPGTFFSVQWAIGDGTSSQSHGLAPFPRGEHDVKRVVLIDDIHRSAPNLANLKGNTMNTVVFKSTYGFYILIFICAYRCLLASQVASRFLLLFLTRKPYSCYLRPLNSIS